MTEATVIHVTLVHGTFARNAKWIRANSNFQAKFKELLSPSKVHFEICQWSGRNSHQARLEASYNLATQLKAAFRKFPDRIHLLIGHSHGGNVILYALKQLDSMPVKFNCIFISTPFILLHDSDIKQTKKNLYSFLSWLPLCFIGLLMLMVFAVITVFVLGIFEQGISRGEDQSTFFDPWATFSLAMVIAAGLTYFFVRLFKKADGFVNKMEALFEEKMGELSIESKWDLVPIIVRVKFDEALLWLRSFQTIAAIPSILYALLNTILSKKGFYASLIVSVPAICLMAAPFLGMQALGKTIWEIELATLAGAVVLYPIVLFLILLFGLLFSRNPLVFGWDTLSNCFLVSVFTADQPKHFKSTRYACFGYQLMSFSHSPYNQQRVIEHIANEVVLWLRQDEVR